MLSPLQLVPVSQADAAESARKAVEYSRERLADPPKPSRYLSADASRNLAQKWLREHEAELALIEGDFAGWNARRRRRAIQRIAVSRATKKALEAVAAKVAGEPRDQVQSLLDEARDYALRPRLFPIPKPSDNQFKDFGFKLLVIEELMYRQEVLKPRFDIHAFAAEYHKREISVEEDGYAVIPEAAQYFRNLAIPAELLARVETLHQSSGLDGGPKFIDHLHPFWDPGAGDDPMKVTSKAVADLELLPNLKRVSGLENSKPGRALKAAFAARGIELVSEDKV